MIIVPYEDFEIIKCTPELNSTCLNEALKEAARLCGEHDVVIWCALKPEFKDAVVCPHCGRQMKIKSLYTERKSGFSSSCHIKVITLRMHCTDPECREKYPSSKGFTRSHVIKPQCLPSKSWYTAEVIGVSLAVASQSEPANVDVDVYDFIVDHEQTIKRWQAKASQPDSPFYICLKSISDAESASAAHESAIREEAADAEAQSTAEADAGKRQFTAFTANAKRMTIITGTLILAVSPPWREGTLPVIPHTLTCFHPPP